VGSSSGRLLIADGAGWVLPTTAARARMSRPRAATFSPFVVLFGQDSADQSGDGVAPGEMPTTSVRLRISRLSRSLGLFDQT